MLEFPPLRLSPPQVRPICIWSAFRWIRISSVINFAHFAPRLTSPFLESKDMMTHPPAGSIGLVKDACSRYSLPFLGLPHAHKAKQIWSRGKAQNLKVMIPPSWSPTSIKAEHKGGRGEKRRRNNSFMEHVAAWLLIPSSALIGRWCECGQPGWHINRLTLRSERRQPPKSPQNWLKLFIYVQPNRWPCCPIQRKSRKPLWEPFFIKPAYFKSAGFELCPPWFES